MQLRPCRLSPITPASKSVHRRTGFVLEPVTSRPRRQLCKRPSAVDLLSPPGFLPPSQIVGNRRKMEFRLQAKSNTDRQRIQVRFRPSGAPLEPLLIRKDLSVSRKESPFSTSRSHVRSGEQGSHRRCRTGAEAFQDAVAQLVADLAPGFQAAFAAALGQ